MRLPHWRIMNRPASFSATAAANTARLTTSAIVMPN
jgi:hypothetical protein